MSEINPVTKDQLFEKKIAENTGSDYNVGDISNVIPVTKDQVLLKEIALNSAGQSGDISDLESKVADNTAAIEAIIKVKSENLVWDNGLTTYDFGGANKDVAVLNVYTINSMDGIIISINRAAGNYAFRFKRSDNYTGSDEVDIVYTENPANV